MNRLRALYSGISADQKVYFLNIGCLLLLYWPVTFLIYNFKWDMVDAYFPYRYHVSLSLLNFELPLWNAHEAGGYPIYIDPQSGVFYPFVWLLSFLFGKYSLYALHTEFLITVWIAACCFYKLCKFFSVSTSTSFVAGMMFAGCGIFIGNTQHLCWLISATYLPGIFYCFFRLSTELKYKYVFALSILLYLFTTGGYPAFNIILLYFLFVFFLYFSFQHYQRGVLKKYIVLCAIASLLTIAISFGFLYSVYSILLLINRGSGITMEMAMQGAFTLPSFLSFLWPFATCRHPELLGTDISMANAYFGIFFLALIPLYLFKAKKTGLEKIILILAIACLLISLGDAFPFRKWTLYLPLMNYFRFPSSFRIFAVIFLLLIAAIQLDKQRSNLPSFRLILYGILLLLFATIIISIWKNYSGTSLLDFFTNKHFFNEHSTLYDHLLLQSLVQLVLLAVFLLLSFVYEKHWVTILYAFILLDLGLSVHLNLPYTSMDSTGDPRALHAKLQSQPDISHIPQNRLFLNNDYQHSLSPLWKNLNDFLLEPAYDGYNPLRFNAYDSLITSIYFPTIIKNYPIYIVEKHLLLSETFDTSKVSTQKIALVNSLTDYKNRTYTNTDTCRFVAISGNSLTIECISSDTATLAVFQNNIPGWKCTVNNKPESIDRISMALMGIKIPPKKSIVQLDYKPEGVSFLFLITFISLLFSLAGLVFYTYKNS